MKDEDETMGKTGSMDRQKDTSKHKTLIVLINNTEGGHIFPLTAAPLRAQETLYPVPHVPMTSAQAEKQSCSSAHRQQLPLFCLFYSDTQGIIHTSQSLLPFSHKN